jgi:hypothetical protein
MNSLSFGWGGRTRTCECRVSFMTVSLPPWATLDGSSSSTCCLRWRQSPQRSSVDVTLPGELIGTILDSFLLAAEIECLTEEVTLRADFREGGARAGKEAV